MADFVIKRVFSTELNGYKKKLVDDFLGEVEKRYEKLEEDLAEEAKETESLTDEISQKNAKIEALEAEIAKLNEEKEGLKNELDIAVKSIEAKHKENEELKAKNKDLTVDYGSIAKVLVEAEKKADEVRNNAVAEAEREKARLNAECDDVRENLNNMIADVSELEVMTKISAHNLMISLEEQLKTFENTLKEKISAETAVISEYAALKKACIDEACYADEAAENADAEDFAVEEAPEAAEEIISDESVIVCEEPEASTEEAEAIAEEPEEDVAEADVAQAEETVAEAETVEEPETVEETEASFDAAVAEEPAYTVEEPTESSDDEQIKLVVEGEEKEEELEDYSFALSDEAKMFFEENN